MTIEPEFSAEPVELRPGVHYTTLTAAYVRWKAEKLLPLIFHHAPDMTLLQFLDWNYSPTVEPVACYRGEQLAGIGWICQAHLIEGRGIVAEVGAAFFQRTPVSTWHPALHLFLQHAFVERGFTAIYGLSARHNEAAREILRYCGMEEADHLPWGQEVESDTMIYKLEREEWLCRLKAAVSKDQPL